METLDHRKWTVFWLVFLGLLFLIPLKNFGQTSTSKVKNWLFNTGKTTVEHKDSGVGIKIEYEGEIYLSEDEKDITSISKGGYIHITKSGFGSKRRIKIETDRKGNLVKEYYVGRSKKNFYPEGKEFLEEILPEILNTTTIGAESRVNRYYNEGGVPLVLRKVEDLESDHVRVAYFQLLLNKEIQNDEYSKIVKTAGETISSDHYLSEILMHNHMACFSDDSMVSAFIEACESIESDHYVTEVLKTVIHNRDVSDEQVSKIIDVSENINSDHYLSVVLLDMLDEREMNASNISHIVQLTDDIDSDHYKSEVLKEVMSHKDLSNETVKYINETIKDIGSDHYMTEIILHMSSKNLDDGSIASLIEMLGENINSDHYLTTSLNDIMDNSNFNNQSFNATIEAMENINSDHYYLTVWAELAERRNLSEDQVIELLDVTDNINSDSYLTDALIEISDIVNDLGGKTKTAYKKAADGINSESYYGKAIKALDF